MSKGQVVEVRPENRETFELLKRVNCENPKPEDVKALQTWLDSHPDTWRAMGDLTAHALKSIVDAAAGKTALVRECVMRDAEARRQALGYDDASPLERLLIDVVVLTGLRWADIERRYSSVHGQGEGMTLAQADWWERRLSAAEGRYLRACESLARVRRLLRHAPVQVNIAAAGGKQVNLAGLLTEQQRAELQAIRKPAGR